MEVTPNNLHISFLGVRKAVGNSFVSINFASEIASRNRHLIYSTCEEGSEYLQFPMHLPLFKARERVAYQKTELDQIDLLTFPAKVSEKNQHQIQGILDGTTKETILIHDIKDPFNQPYKAFLEQSEIWVITLRAESVALLDYFNIIRRLETLPKHPDTIMLVFNFTRDVEKAFKTYQQIFEESSELSFNITPVFLGVIQNDLLRQAHATQSGIPLVKLFSECNISGSIAFMTDKLLKRKTQPPVTENKLLTLIEPFDSDDLLNTDKPALPSDF